MWPHFQVTVGDSVSLMTNNGVPMETFISPTPFSVFVCENDVQTSILNGKLSRGLGLPIASCGNGWHTASTMCVCVSLSATVVGTFGPVSNSFKCDGKRIKSPSCTEWPEVLGQLPLNQLAANSGELMRLLNCRSSNARSDRWSIPKRCTNGGYWLALICPKLQCL